MKRTAASLLALCLLIFAGTAHAAPLDDDAYDAAAQAVALCNAQIEAEWADESYYYGVARGEDGPVVLGVWLLRPPQEGEGVVDGLLRDAARAYDAYEAVVAVEYAHQPVKILPFLSSRYRCVGLGKEGGLTILDNAMRKALLNAAGPSQPDGGRGRGEARGLDLHRLQSLTPFSTEAPGAVPEDALTERQRAQLAAIETYLSQKLYDGELPIFGRYLLDVAAQRDTLPAKLRDEYGDYEAVAVIDFVDGGYYYYQLPFLRSHCAGLRGDGGVELVRSPVEMRSRMTSLEPLKNLQVLTIAPRAAK